MSDRAPPDRTVFSRTCACGARYDQAAWEKLPARGLQPTSPGYHLTLRTCTACGSTLSIEEPDAS